MESGPKILAVYGGFDDRPVHWNDHHRAVSVGFSIEGFGKNQATLVGQGERN